MIGVLGDTTSGEGKTAQMHILVKPVAAELTTNLVTDRCTYHSELNATEKTYMASVSWTYPPADLIALCGWRCRAILRPPLRALLIGPEASADMVRLQGFLARNA